MGIVNFENNRVIKAAHTKEKMINCRIEGVTGKLKSTCQKFLRNIKSPLKNSPLEAESAEAAVLDAKARWTRSWMICLSANVVPKYQMKQETETAKKTPNINIESSLLKLE